jgi:cystathionine beta-lyase/cystathionine gamma-synthase
MRPICAGAKSAKAHRSDSFVKRRENLRFPDRCRDAVPVHVGSQVRTDTCEDHADPLAPQIVEQIAYGLRGGVIDIRDGAGVDNEPLDRRRRALHEATHFIGEAVVVRVKQIRAEPIDDQPWGLVFASGMAAIVTLILAYVRPGETVLHSRPLYGGTEVLIDKTLAPFGVKGVGFTDGLDEQNPPILPNFIPL